MRKMPAGATDRCHRNLGSFGINPSSGVDGYCSLSAARLRLWPVYVLGNRFSGLVAIQPGHALVTTSVYGLIRHPSYLGLLISSLGWALAFRSGVGVLLAVFLVPPLIARIQAEERLLGSQFGAEYDAYCARTPRVIPGLY
jgi:protein-S-isoprenylcysteine O-methyltransferase Ste14